MRPPPSPSTRGAERARDGAPPVGPRTALPAGVWALGVVSLLTDVSSELVHSLLPVYLATTLGASMATIGLIEGVAEGIAAFTRIFSGALSDRLGQRRPLVLAGYGLAALAKPVFPLATTAGWVFAARCMDRFGKGIRGAPRDALIADITPLEQRGAAYGLRQALDSVGGFLGPLLALALTVGLALEPRAALWAASVPGALAVLVIVLAVREPQRAAAASPPVAPAPLALPVRAGGLPAAVWQVIAFSVVMTLARFTDAFLLLRAADVGLPGAWTPAVLALMAAVYAASAYPAGRAADRMSRRGLLAVGLFALVLAHATLALASGWGAALGGAALWGAHLGLTQGIVSALIAQAAPEHRRGTAFGALHLANAGATVVAGIAAGQLWDRAGAPATFALGAGLALAALSGLWVSRPRRPKAGRAG